ncbi:PHD and RING finger domain-containing protein 1-like isoform X2 [Betta splendens]|nr:PHD and RING finger domain-containing protein 1-like isoform X2 [Betta splendens]XP_055366021.1 PHD and RING finger domain-containing protein 1-like isoform X2 [Betta splendens]XP_055366022.1 PHD and RING finger domain-containing protein 1-like isoform X2 [Betta splendens]XP_055366023.1 PHD and RING finger domain-containing protein 1-like isoform X2 [Betta splendens]
MDTLRTEARVALDKCYICLSQFDRQPVASVENCQHVFCLDCILQWCQMSNTCPVDRRTFSFIHQRQHPSGAIKKKIKVKLPKKDDDEEEAAEAVICEECGRSDRRHRLLMCTGCDSGYHMDCLTPSLNTRPEGDWICLDCVSHHCTDSSKVEEDVSEGELMDILAETESTSTSSRLRPSTVNDPSSSTERRRSARTRCRISNQLNHHAQTARHVPKYLLRPSSPASATDKRHHHSSNMKGQERRRNKLLKPDS